MSDQPPESPLGAEDRALSRILAEIYDGLRHGFFEYVLTCEIVGQERRRLTLRAGKGYQFVIPQEQCVRSEPTTGPGRHERRPRASCLGWQRRVTVESNRLTSAT